LNFDLANVDFYMYLISAKFLPKIE